MYTKYAELDNEIIAIDEKSNVTTFSKNSEIDKIIKLENELEMLNVKNDFLEKELETLEKDYINHKTPKQELVKIINGLNASLISILTLTLIFKHAFTLSSLFFIGVASSTLIVITKFIDSVAESDYKINQEILKEELENNYNEISEKQKELSNERVEKKEVKTKKASDISALIRLRNTYSSTYKLDNDKRKNYNRI